MRVHMRACVATAMLAAVAFPNANAIGQNASENGVSRAAVPAVLLSKTSELAKVATGSSAGTVPVGAARLTDEVLKSMFLTKLRAASAANLWAPERTPAMPAAIPS